MNFVDEAVIEVVAGRGGDGIISFRREAKVPRGGPDGGDGGRGGDVIVAADAHTVTLLDHRYRRFYRAERGGNGSGQNATGRSGAPLVIPVPLGTVVRDQATGEILADLSQAGEESVVARGGAAGRGNTQFATSTRRAPRIATDGRDGESRTLELELRLVADVGLVGLPNAGKSTFIRAVTRSQAKVADYPFTTLVPNLGACEIKGRPILIADVPGLIEGAHEGHGLGDRFLRHLERTRVLIHLLSLSRDAPDPVEAYRVVESELEKGAPEVAKRPRVVVLNKIDLLEDRDELALWREAFGAVGVERVFAVSALTREGVWEVLHQVAELLPEAGGEGGNQPYG
jgi:GTP-binding protein